MSSIKNILVIGDSIIDEYIYIEPKKISDEAHVITSEIIDRKFSLGGAGNVARNITSQGHKATYIGLSSKETDATLKKLFNFFEINPKLFMTEEAIQIKTRIISTRGSQVCRYDSRINPIISKETKDKIIKEVEKNINNFDFVIISKYYDFLFDEYLVKRLMSIIKKNNKKVIVDNRQSNGELFKNANYYKVNFNEFKALYNVEKIDNSFDSISNLIKKQGSFFENLIITRSNLPTIVFSKKTNSFFEIPVDEVKVRDVSGAGDTFVATFSIQNSDDIVEVVKKCHSLCNIVVRKLGTEVVWTYEFENDFSVDVLAKHIKKNNKKIVFTNGVFDILHEGHMRILKESKSYGDYLIVGINSDKSVKKYKGNDRPIKSEQERKKILETIKYVDKVIIFDDLTVDRLLKQIKPDFYVKGGDYNINNIPEKKSLKYVKNTIFVNLVKDKSTTNLIKKIKNIQ